MKRFKGSEIGLFLLTNDGYICYYQFALSDIIFRLIKRNKENYNQKLKAEIKSQQQFYMKYIIERRFSFEPTGC